jgi:hypothetical protein
MSVECVKVLWKSDLTVGFTTIVVIVSLKPNLVGFVLSNPQHCRETTAASASGRHRLHHGVFTGCTPLWCTTLSGTRQWPIVKAISYY